MFIHTRLNNFHELHQTRTWFDCCYNVGYCRDETNARTIAPDSEESRTILRLRRNPAVTERKLSAARSLDNFARHALHCASLARARRPAAFLRGSVGFHFVSL